MNVAPYYEHAGITIYHGDCRAVMAELEPASIDAIVTDPPYGLEFMGKEWDRGVPGKEFWSAALRVAKPGAHFLTFGGTRTFHRLTCAIEDAGWEIRDCLMWLYGSGFPKSLDVSKAIDKRKDWRALRELQSAVRVARSELGISQSEAARRMELMGKDESLGGGGFMWFETGQKIPTKKQWPDLKRVLGLSDKFDAAFEAAEREIVETRVDRGGRTVPFLAANKNEGHEFDVTAPATDAAKEWQGWGTALKPAWEPIILAHKPLVGTVAENVQEFGTGAINVDGCRIEGRERTEYGLSGARRSQGNTYGDTADTPVDFDASKGRWPANLLLDEDAAAMLDEQSGETVSPGKVTRGGNRSMAFGMGRQEQVNCPSDSGGASRFFYTAKASKADRGADNDHPTVKPTDLMRYLVRLIAPPGALVLDPFMGSGPTIYAAKEEGCRALGIEQDEKWCEIAARRLAQEVLPFA